MENSEPPEKRRKLSEALNFPGSKRDEEQNEQGSQTTLGEQQTRMSPRVLLNKLHVKPDVFERLRRITKVCEQQMATDKTKREGDVELIEIQLKGTSEETTAIDTTAAVLSRGNAKDVVTEPSVDEEVDKERREQTCLDMQMLKQVLKEVTEKRAKILQKAMAEESIKLHYRIRELERENNELQGIAKTLSSTVKQLVANKQKMKEFTISRAVQVNVDQNLKSDDSLIPVERQPNSSSSTDLSNNVTFTTNMMASNRMSSVRANNLSGLSADITASGSHPKPLSNQGVLRGNQQERARIQTDNNLVHSARWRPTEPLFHHSVSSRGQDEKRKRAQVTQFRTTESEIQHRLTHHQETLQPSVTGTNGVNYQQLQKQPPLAPRFSSNVQGHFQPCVPQLIQVRQQNQQHQMQQQIPREHNQPGVPQSSVIHTQQIQQQTPPSSLSVSLRQQERLEKQQQQHQYQQLTGQQSQHKNLPQQQCHLQQWQQRQHLQTRTAQPSIRSPPLSTHLQKIHVPNAPAGQRQLTNNLVQAQVHSTVSSNSLPDSRNSQIRLANDGFRLPHTALVTSAPSDLIIDSCTSVVNPQQEKNTFIPTQSYVSRNKQESYVNKQNLRGPELVRVNPAAANQCHKSQPAPNVVVQNSQGIQILQSRQVTTNKDEPVTSPQVCISSERPRETVHTLRRSHPSGNVIPKQISVEEASFHQSQLQLENTQTDFTLASRIARPSPEYLVRQRQLQEAHRRSQKQSNNYLQPSQTHPLQHLPHTQDAAKRTSESRDGVKERQPLQSPGVSSTNVLARQHREGERATTVPQSATAISALNRFQSQSPATSQSSLKAAIDNSNNLNHIPKPSISISVMQDGIVLSWNMDLEDNSVQIDNYELFACQDAVESEKLPIIWKKIGIVKALPLPMACTLTQFSSGNKYHFAVRAVDELERAGPFSDACTISLTP